MSSLSNAFVKQFEREVHEAYQRQGSKLRGSVRIASDVQGSTAVFQKIGKGTASTKSTHGMVPVMNLDHTAVEVDLEDYYAGDWVDQLDTLKVNHDERAVIANAGAYALGRKTDELIINAMAAGATLSVDDDTTGLTLAKVLEAFEMLGENYVPDDGNITGSRADIVICDDVEVPRTSDTAGKREDLRSKLDEASYVLTPQGTQIYVGTPHHYYSIYADEPRQELGEDKSYLTGYQCLVLPILTEAGKSQWPERFSREAINQLKQNTGPMKFRSQMMLEPVNIAESRLDPKLLHFYEADLNVDYSATRKRLFIESDEILSMSSYWDPAFGHSASAKQKRDGSVFALVLLGQSGRRYLHDLRYLKVEVGQGDEASQQVRQIFKLCTHYGLRRVAIEINGIGRFLPGILRQTIKVEGLRCSVEEVVSKTAKDIRILEGFDALLAARALYVHRCVTKTPFVTEMQEWAPHGASKAHDDGLDAVAGALARLPQQGVRLSRKEQALRLRETDFSVF